MDNNNQANNQQPTNSQPGQPAPQLQPVPQPVSQPTPVVPARPAAPQTPPTPIIEKKNKKPLIIALIGILLIAGIAVVMFIMLNNKPKTTTSIPTPEQKTDPKVSYEVEYDTNGCPKTNIPFNKLVKETAYEWAKAYTEKGCQVLYFDPSYDGTEYSLFRHLYSYSDESEFAEIVKTFAYIDNEKYYNPTVVNKEDYSIAYRADGYGPKMKQDIAIAFNENIINYGTTTSKLDDDYKYITIDKNSFIKLNIDDEETFEKALQYYVHLRYTGIYEGELTKDDDGNYIYTFHTIAAGVDNVSKTSKYYLNLLEYKYSIDSQDGTLTEIKDEDGKSATTIEQFTISRSQAEALF